jgi:hypothetical protein
VIQDHDFVVAEDRKLALMARARNIKSSFITLNPLPFFPYLLSLSPLSSLISSPKKINPRNHKLCTPPNLSVFFVSLLFSFTFLGISILSFMPTYQDSSSCPLISPPSPFSSSLSSAALSPLTSASLSLLISENDQDEPRLSDSVMVPLPAHGVVGHVSEEEREFWQQPDGEGFRPCLDFSIGYRKASAQVSKEKRRFLVVVASGGLNQQRNEIVDAVVIARILEASLVVPVLQVNLIWGDER